MRWPDLRLQIRHIMVGVALVAVGIFLVRVIWNRTEEIFVREADQNRQPRNRGREFRVWLDPNRLRAYNLSKADIVRALTPSGIVHPKRIGAPPDVVYMDCFPQLDQCENIVLRASPEGEILRLKDVAKVEVSR
jgi:hypothetical protein